MKIEIWSDIMCPFCYIGKRKFEAALSAFEPKNEVEIVWKSFQLAPDMVTEPDLNIDQFLANHKAMPLEQAQQMNAQVAAMAMQSGLVYHFDKTIPANSFQAHQLTHISKKYGLQNEAEEALFQAYFTDGKNIDDLETLVSLGVTIGLDANETKNALESQQYAEAVIADRIEAQQLGVTGVPFFVFDRKFAVSGAQDPAVFTEALQKSFAEVSNPNDTNR